MADRKPLVRYGAIGARSLAACSALLHHPKGPNHFSPASGQPAGLFSLRRATRRLVI
jgi:hypothetical protein